jgi:transcriptional regulator with XRE-family HTH domain
MDDLLAQVVKRAKLFKEKTGLKSRDIAKLTGISEQQICDFLAQRKGLSIASLHRLLNLLNTNVNQIQAKVGPAGSTRIIELQESGKPMHLDVNGGWYPGTDGSGAGTDPNGSTSIVETNKNPARQVPDAEEQEFLAGLAGLHQSIIDKINDWQARKMKARPNANGSTEPPRRINDNSASSEPGNRGDLFSKQEHLDWLKAEREKTEQAIKLERDTKREQELYWAKRVELLRLKDTAK